MPSQRSIGLILSLILYGCAAQSENKLPSHNIPSASDKASTARNYDARWWEYLNDPATNMLVDKAFATNPTLAQALARIDEANAQLEISRSKNFPVVGVNAGVSQNYDDSLASGKNSRTTSIEPSLSWEIDMFGRIRNANRAAESRLHARTADAQNTRIILASDIATAALDFQACRSFSLVLDSDLTSRKKTLRLIQKKVQAGFSAPIDQDSATRDLAFVLIELALKNELCQNHLNALIALTGMDRGAILELIAWPRLDEIELAIPASVDFPTHIEAAALLSHPSVRAAVHDAQAARMDIDVATAERLPKLDLSALVTGQWINSAGTTLNFTRWALAASASGTLFDGGRGAANVDASDARYRGALAILEGALRSAVQTAQDNLAAQQSANDRYKAATTALAAAQSAFTANEALWKNGSASLLELEDSRRQLSTAQINLIAAKRDRTAAWIALHRVFGEAIHSKRATDEED